MSRAFVNEDNAAEQADQPVERQVSAQPNYVTPAGLAQLQTKVAELQHLLSEQSSNRAIEQSSNRAIEQR
jgi:hypothetical protein